MCAGLMLQCVQVCGRGGCVYAREGVCVVGIVFNRVCVIGVW